MAKFKKLFIACLILVVAALPLSAQSVIKMATTTSTYDTGLLDVILKPFEEQNNVKVYIISVGTGRAIRLGENGDVDLILVHARKAENRFIAEGYGVNRRDVMYNDFVIVGPEKDPVGIKGMDNPIEVFRKIYNAAHPFISRGDDSGTHKRETLIWEETSLSPRTAGGSWYMESGQGMGATLRIADEKDAYVMVDRGTFLFQKDKVQLKLLVHGGPVLLNPYGVIAVNPYKHKSINYQGAMKLIAWLTCPECQEMIGNYKVNNNILFWKNATSPMK